jgi:hypothetical protein
MNMADKPTMAELQEQMAALQRELAKLTGTRAKRREPAAQTDYVEPGSDRHAAMLGLREATSEDGKLIIDGWTLDDITSFPPSTTPEYLMRMLRQKVNELTATAFETQSRSPLEPGFAPTMWRPGTAFRDVTE